MKNLILNYLPSNYSNLSFKNKKIVIVAIKRQINLSNNAINTLLC